MKYHLIAFGVLLMTLVSCQLIDFGPKADLDVKCGSYPVFIPVKMDNVDRKSIVWSLEGLGSLEPMNDGNVRYKLPADCSSQLGSMVIVKADYQNLSEQYVLRLAPKRTVDSVVCLGEKCFSFDKKNRPLNDLNSPENLKPFEGFLNEYRKLYEPYNSVSFDKEGWMWIRSSGSLYVYPGGISEFGSGPLNEKNLIKIGFIQSSAIDSNGDLVVVYAKNVSKSEFTLRRYFRPYLNKASILEDYEEFHIKELFSSPSECALRTPFPRLRFDTNNNVIITFYSSAGNFCAYGNSGNFYFDDQFNLQNLDPKWSNMNTAGLNGDFWGFYYDFYQDISRIVNWRRNSISGEVRETHFDYSLRQRRFYMMAFDEDGDLWTIELIPEDPLPYPYTTFSSELSEYSLSSSGDLGTLTLKTRVKTPNLSPSEGIKFYGL